MPDTHIVDELPARIAAVTADALTTGEPCAPVALSTEEATVLLAYIAEQERRVVELARRNENLSQSYRVADDTATKFGAALHRLGPAIGDTISTLQRVAALLDHPANRGSARAAASCATIARDAAAALHDAVRDPDANDGACPQ